MTIAAGVLGIVFGGVIGWLVRDIVAYRPPSRRKRIVLDDYWRSWPAMVENLRRITRS